MSVLWWVPLAVAAVAVGVSWWMTRRVAREVAALAASAAGLADLRPGLATVRSEIASTWRAVEHLELQ
jgi:hypothetical protein